MKLFVRKIYCPRCKKLVHGEERKVGDSTQFMCFRCGKPVWIKSPIGWKYIRE